MSSPSDLLRNALASEDPTPVTTALARWDGTVPDWVFTRMLEVMANDYNTKDRGDGSGRLRPSSLKEHCDRLKILSFLGHQSADSDEAMNDMAEGGTWIHYKYQLEGLAAGIFSDVEVPVEFDPWLTKGSADAVMVDGIPFELKTMISFKFAKAVRYKDPTTGRIIPRPLEEHMFQTHTVMKALGVKKCSLMYVNRDTMAKHEFLLHWDDAVGDRLDEMMPRLREHALQQTIPERLHGCDLMRGSVYNNCDWKKACFSV